MITLTEEQAQQIEEALKGSGNVHALSIFYAARAHADHIADADKMVREPVFKARKAFWKVALGNNTKLANLAKAAIDEVEKYAAPVEPVKQEPVAWRVRGYNQFKTGNPAPWRYVDGTDKPTVNIPDCCDFEPLYAEPVDAKAIRAEALEYAAYICDGIAHNDSGFVAEECANAIRSLK